MNLSILNRLVVAWLVAPIAGAVAQSGSSSANEETRAGDVVSIEELVEQVRPSLVTVMQVGRDGSDRGIGSGFVVAKEGLIATNLHVAGEGRQMKIRLADGSKLNVVAMHAWDRKLDLAVIRVDSDELEPLELARPSDVRQGVETLAMGNPEGLEFSVTRGVISGLREVNGIDMIQAAVPIERGNSGGPLIDRAGKVLGILTLKSAITENLGYAMPVGRLKELLDNPNTIPIEYWQRIGRLNQRLWQVPKATGGAVWRQRTGTISVQGASSGFGGRALCLSTIEVPELPYEIALEVKLDDESGAGGIAFGSDGAHRHYGFYPSAGQLRLTRFDGPTVYSWNILAQVASADYRPGDWNRLRVRVEADRILCFVNGNLVIESDDRAWRNGSAGLCKFRQTEPLYRRFEMGPDLAEKNDVPEDFADALERFSRGDMDGESLLAEFDSNRPPAGASGSAIEAAIKALRKRADDLEELSAQLHRRRVRDALIEVLDVGEREIDLLRAALLVAHLDNPELIIGDYVNELDRMAAELEENIAVASTPDGGGELRQLSERQRLELLGLYLFEQNGFHGSRSDYYHKSNSYLNEVLDDREGLPITLSVVYMELGRRIDLEIVGVPLPGHFVVRHEPKRKGALAQLVDPFERGKFITEDDAARMVKANTGLDLTPDHLEPASKRDIVVRMLRNLAGLAVESENPPSALPYLDLLLAISPEEPQERLSRAILSFQAGNADAAKRDIDWLIEHRPPGIEIDRLVEWRSSLNE